MEKLPFLMFKGQCSLDFGLLIAEKGSYKGAQRDITYTSVAGRSGDLITDNGRYKNINIPYKLSLLNTTEREFVEITHQIKGWLLAEQGYFPLWDSYDARYYRLASYSDEVDIEQELRDLGSLSLTFNCKPFKYSFEAHKGGHSIQRRAFPEPTVYKNRRQRDNNAHDQQRRFLIVGSGRIHRA